MVLLTLKMLLRKSLVVGCRDDDERLLAFRSSDLSHFAIKF